ncbi:MAG: DNA/RNA non-specific endonuclease [Bacteroidales bacterium]|nr:DNA/RNA non-specific endonuclease [Bacteroidales bacterium]
MSRRLAILGSLLALGTLLLSCEEDDETIPVLTVSRAIWTADGGTQTVKISATSTWTIDVQYASGQSTGWIHFSPSSGSGFASSVMTVDPNGDGSARQAEVYLRSPHYYASASISQSGGAATMWLEIPAVDPQDKGFFTHAMDGGLYLGEAKSGVRNWSFLWDYENHLSHWVAYPLNKGLRGSGFRSDQWGFDPLLPYDIQPNVTFTYGGGWTRGHQIPSADRLNYAANVSTFYGTNMTPQDYDFNTYIWANLEQKVRDYAMTCDTLYVVTGCDINGSTSTSGGNTGFYVPIPVAYYKALLRRKNNEYSAVGFYLPHFLPDPEHGNYMDYIMSIDELEEKTGEDFFPALSVLLGASKADAIESAAPLETVKKW